MNEVYPPVQGAVHKFDIDAMSERRTAMRTMMLSAVACVVMVLPAAAEAQYRQGYYSDHHYGELNKVEREYREKFAKERRECSKKRYEADSRREFVKAQDECSEKLDEVEREYRKKLREERHKSYEERYDRYDDD